MGWLDPQRSWGQWSPTHSGVMWVTRESSQPIGHDELKPTNDGEPLVMMDQSHGCWPWWIEVCCIGGTLANTKEDNLGQFHSVFLPELGMDGLGLSG